MHLARELVLADVPTPALVARADLVGRPEPHFAYDAIRRAIDVVLALTFLLFSLPLLLAAALLIAVTTRQNPILRQRRVGFLGEEFAMLKLRTMNAGVRDCPSPADDGVLVGKAPDDARVSRVGRPLRRSSIDELPQLFNVLAGQMTLVGPRPGLPEEVERYPASWRRRLTVKPGLTGLWQVSGRCEVEPRRRMAMDRSYIRRRSVPFDCAILLRTVVAVVSMRGAW